MAEASKLSENVGVKTSSKSAQINSSTSDKSRQASTNCSASQEVMSKSHEKSKIPKVKKLRKNMTREGGSSKNKVSNLQTLIANKKTRDIGLFYSMLAEQPTPNFDSAESSEKSKLFEADVASKSSKLIGKSKRSELEKKHKLPNKNIKSMKLNKKAESSQLKVKTKTTKSPKRTMQAESPLISEFLHSLQELRLSESNSTNSSQSGNEDVFEDDSELGIMSYFNLFKHSEAVSSSKESSDSGTLTPDSDGLESAISESHIKIKNSKSSEPIFLNQNLTESTVKSKPSDQFMQSHVDEISMRSNQLEPSVRPKLPKPLAKSKLLPEKSKISDGTVRSKLFDPSVKSKFPRQSVRSKLLIPSLKSTLSEQSSTSESSDKLSFPDLSVRSKLSDKSVKSKLPKSSSKSKIYDPTLKSNLTQKFEKTGAVGLTRNVEPGSQQLMTDFKLKEFVLSRRSEFFKLQNYAKGVKKFMDKNEALKKSCQDIKIAKTDRKKDDSVDWMKMLYYWDIVRKEINMIIETTSVMYDFNGNILMTSDEFHIFMTHLLCAFRDIWELNCTSRNGLIKYTRFCTCPDQFLFLSHAVVFESIVSNLFKKLRAESEHFTAFKKNENN